MGQNGVHFVHPTHANRACDMVWVAVVGRGEWNTARRRMRQLLEYVVGPDRARPLFQQLGMPLVGHSWALPLHSSAPAHEHVIRDDACSGRK